MKIENNKQDNGDLEIKVVLSMHDQICLEHDLLDIVEWYSKGPLLEKIQSCRKRMINENRAFLMQSKEIMSKTMQEINDLFSNPEEICNLIKKLPNYKNRKQRESENSEI